MNVWKKSPKIKTPSNRRCCWSSVCTDTYGTRNKIRSKKPFRDNQGHLENPYDLEPLRSRPSLKVSDLQRVLMLEGLFPIVWASKYTYIWLQSEFWGEWILSTSVLHMKPAMIGGTNSSGNLGCGTSKVYSPAIRKQIGGVGYDWIL